MDIRKIKIDTEGFDRDAILSARKIRLTPAACALDLGDGSERGEYVNQDYILNKLGRPHRAISLMYTYYPKDKEWPARSSEAYPDMEVHGQWEYPYDDYFVYGGGIGGDPDAEVFRQMRDVRRHGQDVNLTLTIDCSLEDDHLIQIAKDLRSYGRMRLRINHECAGDWFTHNKRFSRKEVADFFVRFHNIIKEYAPNVSTVFCSGMIGEDGRMEYEEDFLPAYKAADVWSADQYLALHFGWPFDICEKKDFEETFALNPVEKYIEAAKKTTRRLAEINGGEMKPFTASEFNTDGDVTGPAAQGEGLLAFAKYLKENKPAWYNSMSMYQFRDRGRLGLETEDPNNEGVGIEQPLLEDYKKILQDEYFKPGIEAVEEIDIETKSIDEKSSKEVNIDFVSNEKNSKNNLIDIVDENASRIDGAKTDEVQNDTKRTGKSLPAPVTLRWGSAEDSDGLELKVRLEGKPVFFDIELPKEMNLMISVNDRWFYKSPGVEIIDAMPAFFERNAKPVTPGEEISMLIFAPPAEGENPDNGRDDWALNYYTELSELPKLRIRYEACGATR